MSDARQQRIDELRAKGDGLSPFERGQLRALTRAEQATEPFERGQERARERFGRKAEKKG